jgi:hypothetical protein
MHRQLCQKVNNLKQIGNAAMKEEKTQNKRI